MQIAIENSCFDKVIQCLVCCFQFILTWGDASRSPCRLDWVRRPHLRIFISACRQHLASRSPLGYPCFGARFSIFDYVPLWFSSHFHDWYPISYLSLSSSFTSKVSCYTSTFQLIRFHFFSHSNFSFHRTRNLKNKIANAKELAGLKQTPMGMFLKTFGVEGDMAHLF